MRRSYYTLDVFTANALEGNPLAVVMDADGLDDERMQSIAREFNLSETVFVLEPRDPVNSARIRIFTPARELPFAGHPTVGTAALLGQVRAPEILARQDLSVVIEEQIGTVKCLARKVKGTLRASFTLPNLPTVTDDAPPDARIAAALNLAVEEIGFDGHAPCIASAGVPLTFVPLATREAAARAWPDMGLWGDCFTTGGVFLYTRETVREGSDLHARMFAPEMGMMEDPATGSAVAALAGVLMRNETVEDGDHTIVVEQGLEMGRPSFITLGLEVAAGVLVAASIGGAAVIVAQGHLDL